MRSIAQKFAKVFGAVYVLVGVLGFLSVAGGTASQTPNVLLGIFGVTLAHNIAHLAIGAAFLVGSYSPSSARITCVTIGAAYVLLGTVGLLEYESIAELLNINQADNLLHFGTGLFAIMFGLVDVPISEAKDKAKRESRREKKAPQPAPATPAVPETVASPVVEPAHQLAEETAVHVEAAAPATEPAAKAPRESRKARKSREAASVQASTPTLDSVPAPAPEVPVAGPAKAPRESRKARKAREAESVALAAAAGMPSVPAAIPAPVQGSTYKIKWESRSAREAREAEARPKVESAGSWIVDDVPAAVAPVPSPSEVSMEPAPVSAKPTQELVAGAQPMTPRELSKQAQRTAKAARKAQKAASAPAAQASPKAASPPPPPQIAEADEIAQGIRSIQAPVSAADRKSSRREARALKKGRKAHPQPSADSQGVGAEMERLDNPVLVGGPSESEKTQEYPPGN